MTYNDNDQHSDTITAYDAYDMQPFEGFTLWFNSGLLGEVQITAIELSDHYAGPYILICAEKSGVAPAGPGPHVFDNAVLVRKINPLP